MTGPSARTFSRRTRGVVIVLSATAAKLFDKRELRTNLDFPIATRRHSWPAVDTDTCLPVDHARSVPSIGHPLHT